MHFNVHDYHRWPSNSPYTRHKVLSTFLEPVQFERAYYNLAYTMQYYINRHVDHLFTMGIVKKIAHKVDS